MRIRQFPALAQFDAHRAVAGECAGAGKHQVANAGQAGQRLASPAASYREPRNLRDTACHQRGSGVIAESNPGGHARRNRDHILERAA